MLSKLKVGSKAWSLLPFLIDECLLAILDAEWFKVANIEDEAFPCLVRTIQSILSEFLFVMIDQWEWRKTSNQFAIGSLNNGHAIWNPIAAVVKALRWKLILTSSVYKFTQPNEHVSWIKEAVYFYKLLLRSHFGEFWKIGWEELCFNLFRKHDLNRLPSTYFRVSILSLTFLSSKSKNLAISFCFYKCLLSSPFSA